jgi:hypothetical protein
VLPAKAYPYECCDENLEKKPSELGLLQITGSENSFAASPMRGEPELRETRLSAAAQSDGYSGISVLHQMAMAVNV